MQTMAPPEDAQKERFARIDERFVEVNRRFDEVDGKFVEVNRRFDEVDGKFVEVNRRFDEVDGKFVEVNRRITEISAATNRRLENVESEIGLLRHQMAALNVTFNRGSFGIVASVLGVIAAILAKGG
jgi:uncharacterized coiled-coil DUF342 family protein